MEALATPVVSILTDGGAYTFARRGEANQRSRYSTKLETLSELKRSRPGSVFDIASRWQLVPEKLYRHEDRAIYISGQYPTVDPEAIASVALPALQAVGVYERSTTIPQPLSISNHVAELLVASAAKQLEHHTTFGQLFVLDTVCWIVLCKNGELIYLQPHHLAGAEDAVFYLQATFQQYGLVRSKTPLLAGGSFTTEGQLGRLLSIYFEVLPMVSDVPGGDRLGPLELLDAYQAALRGQLAPHG